MTLLSRLSRFIFAIALLAVAGILIGAHYGGRALSESEDALARNVFGKHLDATRVRIVFDSPYSTFAPVTLGSTIHMNTSWLAQGAMSDLATTSNMHIFVHELAHAMQYERDGWRYLVMSVFAQAKAWITTGSRLGAYDWEVRLRDGAPLTRWNPEEEAQAISDFVYDAYTVKDVSRAPVMADLACTHPVLVDNFCISEDKVPEPQVGAQG